MRQYPQGYVGEKDVLVENYAILAFHLRKEFLPILLVMISFSDGL